jgi:hypothetical protein
MVSRNELMLSESGLFSLEIRKGENEQNVDAALEVAREKMVNPDIEWSKVEINFVKDHAIILSWSQPVRRGIREELMKQVH